MAEEPQEQTTDEQQPEQEAPHGTDWKAEAQKWEKRAKANKAKADQWDAQEEAGKTELQKAQELAAKYKKQLDEVNAAKERGEQVKAAAEKYGVDSDMLARMGGDVDENAQWLKDRTEKSERRYPTTRDRGESSKTSKADPMREAARLMFSRNN
jgi:hypothetical protein